MLVSLQTWNSNSTVAILFENLLNSYELIIYFQRANKNKTHCTVEQPFTNNTCPSGDNIVSC